MHWVLEKEMAMHSSVLAWRIPGMAEPGGLPSMGSHRVRHDWSDLAAAAAAAAAGNSNVQPVLKNTELGVIIYLMFHNYTGDWKSPEELALAQIHFSNL